jgi:hypothetical protein
MFQKNGFWVGTAVFLNINFRNHGLPEGGFWEPLCS